MDYVALGHLHKYHYVTQSPVPIAYSGSPLAYSFSESEQEKFVLLLESKEGANLQVKVLSLVSGLTLVQKRFNSIDEAIEWLVHNPDFLVDLTVKVSHGINAEDRIRLFRAHQNIISLIPERDAAGDESIENELSPFENMEFLFTEFYKSSNQHPPSEEVMSLFKEIIAQS